VPSAAQAQRTKAGMQAAAAAGAEFEACALPVRSGQKAASVSS